MYCELSSCGYILSRQGQGWTLNNKSITALALVLMMSRSASVNELFSNYCTEHLFKSS